MWANKMQLTESQFNLLMNLVDSKIQFAIQSEIDSDPDRIKRLLERCDKLTLELKAVLVE